MAVTVRIPTPLRPFTADQSSVAVEGTTIGEILHQLTSIHSDLRQHLYDQDGRLRSFVNIYLNDEEVRYLGREATVVQATDTISIVPSIAGGIEVAEPPQLSHEDVQRYSR